MNIKQFLEDNNIRYWPSGKNVSKNHINIQCPFCNDKSNHLGIRIYDLKCNCWKCGKKNIIRVILKLTNYSYKEVKNIVKSLSNKNIFKNKEKVKITKKYLDLEKFGFTKNFQKSHFKYLKQRGFNPKKIINKYDLYVSSFEGKYKFRIIIPIYMNHKLVSFTSRDITNLQEEKYKNAKQEDSIIDLRKCIFNYDFIKPYKDAIWVEGPFDVMKLGDGSFCFLGIEMTPERIMYLSKKKINTLYTIQDNDINEVGENAVYKISLLSSGIAKKIKNIKLRTKKDPGELTIEEAKQIKNEIGFNY